MSRDVYKEFIAYVRELYDVEKAIGLLEWDQETYMPLGCVENRATTIATLTGIYHKMLTSKKLDKYLQTLQKEGVWQGLNDYEKVNVREINRKYEKETKLPEDLVKAIAKAKSRGFDSWIKAKKKHDFSVFAPDLQTLVDLKKKVADCYGYKYHPYDALLDDYEPYLTTKDLGPVFNELEKKLVAIVQRVLDSGYKPKVEILKRHYSIKKQEKFIRSVITDMGFDWNIGRLDISAHPFTMSMGTDVRITTRYIKNYLSSALFGAIHEAGHALYDMGYMPEHQGTPMAEAISLGYHESQSRLWENIVGRSRVFWQHYFPKLKTLFRRQLDSVDLSEFYHAINYVTPSFIRVEADELTYNLHILVRYNIEMMIFDDRIETRDTPEVWNDLMERYLHIRPKDISKGVLQDIHWSQGYFGYFPTYTLGNLYAAQIFNSVRNSIKDIDDKLAQGKLIPLKTWLNNNIHRFGKMYTAQEITKKITGEELNPEHIIRYIKEKYGDIYGIML